MSTTSEPSAIAASAESDGKVKVKGEDDLLAGALRDEQRGAGVSELESVKHARVWRRDVPRSFRCAGDLDGEHGNEPVDGLLPVDGDRQQMVDTLCMDRKSDVRRANVRLSRRDRVSQRT